MFPDGKLMGIFTDCINLISLMVKNAVTYIFLSGLVKVWDVRVGKVLQEFVEHTSPVTCVKFHPHEFLLASCGSDKTVNFWDMEKFQLVSKFEKDNTSIR